MPNIIGIGETLFDVFPDGARLLGGATLNFAVHAHQVQAACGGSGVPVTRIGADPAGDRIIEILSSFGVNTAYVQRDPARATGEVRVTFDEGGGPSYEILEGVAWDFYELDERAAALAARCDAVCFGTLAQRSPASQAGIQAFLEGAPQAFRLCDINFRQRYFDGPLVRRSLELATALKLNGEELEVISGLLGLKGSAAERIAGLMRDYRLEFLILTRGEAGTVIYTGGGEFEGERARFEAEASADPVGAGDACAAAATAGLLLGHPPDRVATFANRVGAFVAARAGATPRLPERLRIKADCTLPV